MAYQEAIETTTRVLIGHIENRAQSGNTTLGQYLKDCLYAATIFNTEAEHLQVAAEAAKDQALDLLIDIKKKLENSQSFE